MTLADKSELYRRTLIFPTCRSEPMTSEDRKAIIRKQEKRQRMQVNLATVLCGSGMMVVILLWFVGVI